MSEIAISDAFAVLETRAYLGKEYKFAAVNQKTSNRETKLLGKAALCSPSFRGRQSRQRPSPLAPGNLKADVNGIIADLSWDWGNAGEPTLAESFEADAFAAPRSVKNTYSFGTSAGGNWEIFSFEDYEGTALPTTASVPH